MMVEFCKCGRILTIRQMENNLPCEKCQKEHAEEFKDRFEQLGQTKEE
jgi:hypothetical protein